jgi:hypothetical protein
MFTLKLYKDGPLPPEGRTEIIQTTGLWVNHGPNDVKQVLAFRGQVGASEYDTFYVGGKPEPDQDAINIGVGGNHYGWAVLENAQGKTTEMFR